MKSLYLDIAGYSVITICSSNGRFIKGVTICLYVSVRAMDEPVCLSQSGRREKSLKRGASRRVEIQHVTGAHTHVLPSTRVVVCGGGEKRETAAGECMCACLRPHSLSSFVGGSPAERRGSEAAVQRGL